MTEASWTVTRKHVEDVILMYKVFHPQNYTV